MSINTHHWKDWPGTYTALLVVWWWCIFHIYLFQWWNVNLYFQLLNIPWCSSSSMLFIYHHDSQLTFTGKFHIRNSFLKFYKEKPWQYPYCWVSLATNWYTNKLYWLCRYLMSCFLMLTGLWMLVPGCGCLVPHSSNNFSTATARCGMGGKLILMVTISGEYSDLSNCPTIIAIHYQVILFQAVNSEGHHWYDIKDLQISHWLGNFYTVKILETRTWTWIMVTPVILCDTVMINITGSFHVHVCSSFFVPFTWYWIFFKWSKFHVTGTTPLSINLFHWSYNKMLLE